MTFDIDTKKYKMTEQGLYKNLLKNEESIVEYNLDYNFCKQQSQTAKLISRKLTELIYESYKRKSCASTSKRHQVLKFINNICEVPEHHVYEDYLKCVLEQVKNNFPCKENEEVRSLTNQIYFELKKYDIGFSETISMYNARKSAREKEKQNQIDFINERNQQKLKRKYHLEIKKKYMFNTNENLLNKIIRTDSLNSSFITQSTKDTVLHTEDNRNAQVKLAYAMANIGETEVLIKILQRLSIYEELTKTELNFLKYIWATQYDNILDIEKHLSIFYFLLEEILLKHATSILSLEADYEVCKFFVNLENDCDILKIRRICKNDYNCYLKLKSCLYQLYCLSYCNQNVIKLSEIII